MSSWSEREPTYTRASTLSKAERASQWRLPSRCTSNSLAPVADTNIYTADSLVHADTRLKSKVCLRGFVLRSSLGKISVACRQRLAGSLFLLSHLHQVPAEALTGPGRGQFRIPVRVLS